MNSPFLRNLLRIFTVIALAALALPRSVAAQSADEARFDLAYVSLGNIYLASIENGAVTSTLALTQDAAGGNSSPAWSADGRYLLYTHYEGSAVSLRIIDTYNLQVMREIPNACCGVWDPQAYRIAYVSSDQNAIIVAQADGAQASVLWYLENGMQPLGKMAWAPNGTLYLAVSRGDAITQVWAVQSNGSVEMVAGPAAESGMMPSSNALSSPAVSADGTLSVIMDTSALGYAPGGPVVLIGYGGATAGDYGRWQAELFGGSNVSWAPSGQRFAWEQWDSCTSVGIDAPGFCPAGIGVTDVGNGAGQLILAGAGNTQPAWRPQIPTYPTEPPPAAQPQATEAIATEAPQPTAAPQGSPLPGDGYSPANSDQPLLTRILEALAPPVEASYSPESCRAQLAGPNNLYEGQCTWFVGKYRPDVCQWGGGNAYQWVEKAQSNGAALGIVVRAQPKVGDIAVWLPSTEAGCGGVSKIPAKGPCTIGASGNWEGCGHVAYVVGVSNDGKTMRILEGNWDVDRTGMDIEVLPCMRFISMPESKTTAPITTPVPPRTTPESRQSNPSLLDQVVSWFCTQFGWGCSSSW